MSCVFRSKYVHALLFCHRFSLDDARRLEKAFQNAPISDFCDAKLCSFNLKLIDNGYTWSRVFGGCLEYEEDTIAVPLDMPPATVLFPARLVIQLIFPRLHTMPIIDLIFVL